MFTKYTEYYLYVFFVEWLVQMKFLFVFLAYFQGQNVSFREGLYRSFETTSNYQQLPGETTHRTERFLVNTSKEQNSWLVKKFCSNSPDDSQETTQSNSCG